MSRIALFGVLVFVVCVACCALPASGQDSVEELPDSLKALVNQWRFPNNYAGGIRANVSQLELSNRFNSGASLGEKFTSNARIDVRQTRYRLNNRRDSKKLLNGGLFARLGWGWNGTMNIVNNKIFNRTVTFDGRIQEFRNDVLRGYSGLDYKRALPLGLRVEGQAIAAVQSSKQTFKTDDDLEGGLSGALKQTSYLWGGRANWMGRAHIHAIDQEASTSTASGIKRFKGLGSDSDSLIAGFRFWRADSTKFEATYSRYTNIRESLELPRGVFNEQVLDEDLVEERQENMNEVLSFLARVVPMKNVLLTVEAFHREVDNRFKEQKARDNGRIVDDLKGKLEYLLGKTRIFVDLQNNETFNDQGEQSAASYLEKRQGARMNIVHPFSETLSANLFAGTQLLQTFYENADITPRDRDQLDQFANIRINSQPFPKISATIAAGINSTDFVNISNTLSQNNRTETSFNLRPEFTYTINQRVGLTQRYGLNIEFTDFVFTEDENFLDRNITFTNTIFVNFFERRLNVDVKYDLLLHDRGSYLAPFPGAERLLSVEQEDRKDRMEISMRYALSENLTLLGKSDFTRRRDQVVGSSFANVFTEGGVEIGLQGKYEIGTGRALNLFVKKVNRFGQFNTPEQEDYWVADTTLNFAF